MSDNRAGSPIQAVLVPALPPAKRALLTECFSPTEQAQYERLPCRRRVDWLASRLALKHAYQRAGGPRATREIEVIHDAVGRPAIAGARVRCSLAHAGGGGLGVVGPVPVGADLESAGRYDAPFVQAVADAREIALVAEAGVPGGLVPTVAWTLKEAVLKAVGIGLGLHPRRAVITARCADGWLVRARDRRERVSTWQVTATLREGLCLAVAQPPGAASVRLTTWRDMRHATRRPRAEVVA